MKVKSKLKNKQWKVVWGIITIIILALPKMLVGTLSINIIDPSLFEIVWVLLLLVLLPGSCIGVSIYYFINCFKVNRNIYNKLITIVVAYVVLIMSFSSIYYFETYVGDYLDAASKYNFYSFYAKDQPKNSFSEERKKKILSNNYKKEGDRAFKGIKDRLWSGVDYDAYYKHEIDFTDEILFGSYGPREDIIKFIPENWKGVYFDCLYFSTITISTVGYGDISPNQWYSKLTVIIQVVLGQALIIFAVGFFFYNLGNNGEKLGKDESEY